MVGLVAATLAGARARAAAPGDALSSLGGLRILVPTLPGGTLDLLARLTAQALGQFHRVQATVLNLEGAAGEIALRRLLAEPADGRTWLLAPESLITINPSLYPRASTDILDGLTAVARIATSHFYLLVREEDPINSLDDLVRQGRVTQPALGYGSGGIGTLHHLSMESFAASQGLKLLHVPYKGNSQAVQALVRGDVRLLMAGSSALPLVESARLRMLAVTAAQRRPAFANVPTMAELVPGLQTANWFGIFGRSAVPESLVTDLRGVLQQMLENEDLRRQLRERAQVDAGFLAGAAFLARIQEDRQRYAGLVRQLALPVGR